MPTNWILILTNAYKLNTYFNKCLQTESLFYECLHGEYLLNECLRTKYLFNECLQTKYVFNKFLQMNTYSTNAYKLIPILRMPTD